MTGDPTRAVIALVDGERVLTILGRRGLAALPDVDQWSDLEEIAIACGVATAHSLGPRRRLADGEPAIHVVAAAPAAEISRTDVSWATLDELGISGVPLHAVEVIAATLREHRGASPFPELRPAWFGEGWLADAERWIDDRVGALGCRRVGATVPHRLWSLSAVLRTPIDGPGGARSLWFKAPCDWFRAEAAITEWLATLVPAHVPVVVAVDLDRAWMLMEELPGHHLRERAELAPAVAAVVATTQIAALDHAAALVAAGGADRSLGPTLDALHRLVHDSVELDRLTAAERATAVAMEPWVAERVAALFATGIPTTLTHGDCHLGNVSMDGERVVIYDWTDASISHPFLDGAHLARQAGDEHRAAVAAAFTAPWRAAFPGADVDRAWDLARLGDRVFQAISYEGIARAQEALSRWEMAGMVAGELRTIGEEFAAATGAAKP